MRELQVSFSVCVCVCVCVCMYVCLSVVLVVSVHTSPVYWSYVRTETGSQDGYLDGGCGT